jgi:hypothetical protein
MWYAIQLFGALIELAFLAALVASSIWLYVRFRLPSIPWLWAAAAIIVANEFLCLIHFSIDQFNHIASQLAISVGDLAVIHSWLISIFATLAKIFAAWFVLSEITFAYAAEPSESHIARTLLIPRYHPAKIGTALIACLLARNLMLAAMLLLS